VEVVEDFVVDKSNKKFLINVRRRCAMKNLFVKLACIPALLFFAGFCHAGDGEWEYLFAPYFWGAGLDGTVGARGLQVEIDASFGDVFDHLQFGGQGHFEASNGEWVILTDFTYIALGASPPVAVIDVNEYIVEGGAGRRFGNFDLLFGGRYNRIDQKIRLKGPAGLRAEADQNWFDPYVGGRIIAPLSEKVSLALRGDIGGFGVGSDFAYYLNALMAIRVSQRVALAAFYRYQHMDYENDDNDFIYDISFHGPGAGLIFFF
jgi:hypothetical protein